MPAGYFRSLHFGNGSTTNATPVIQAPNVFMADLHMRIPTTRDSVPQVCP